MENSSPPLGELLRRSWDIYTNNFHYFLLLAVIFILPFRSFSAYFNPTSLSSPNITPPESMWSFLPVVGFVAVVEMAGVLVGVLVMLAVMRGVRAALQHHSLSLRLHLRESVTLWLPAVVTSFLHVFFLAGLSLFLIVPGIVFAGYWVFTTSAVALSNKKYFAALQYSRTLIKGRWWEVVGRILGCALLLAPLVMLFLFPVLLITPGLPHSILEAISLTVVEVIAMFFSIFLVVYFLELEKTVSSSQK